MVEGKKTQNEKDGTLSRMGLIIAIIAGLVAFTGAIIAVYNYFENRYIDIKKELIMQMRVVEIRLELKMRNDTLEDLQEKVWALEDESENDPNNKTLKYDLKRRMEDKKSLEEEIFLLKQARTKLIEDRIDIPILGKQNTRDKVIHIEAMNNYKIKGGKNDG
jgi:hypothetical protein